MISAVITGDIVASTQLRKPELAKLLKTLQLLMVPYPHEFFRGDSFQVYLKNAEEAFQLLLTLRVAAMKIQVDNASSASDIRASIAIGKVKPPVTSIGTAIDEAFVLSGRLFEKLRSPQRLLIAAPEKNVTVNTAFHLLASFTDFIFERMTVKQAEVVYELLLRKTQTDVAKTLKKAQATVHKHAQAAGWPALENLINDFKLLTGNVIL